jgi:hypothetical protein
MAGVFVTLSQEHDWKRDAMTDRSDEPIKYMDLNEFADDGWLQEANRQFFHPLGLALEVSDSDQSGRYDTIRIWDYREDPEGMVFGTGMLKQAKVDLVAAERKKHQAARAAIFDPQLNVRRADGSKVLTEGRVIQEVADVVELP